MTEYSEPRVSEITQTFVGVPGGPDTTPNYMQEYPEPNGNATTYDGKNAIWNVGTSPVNSKNISFAESSRGLQFKANTFGNSGPIGAPGNPDSTNVYLRVKRSLKAYTPWYEIYHTEKFDKTKLAIKTTIDKKADIAYVDSLLASKVEVSNLNECTNNISDTISAKAERSYVETNVKKKAYKSLISDGLKDKIDHEEAQNSFGNIEYKVTALNTKISKLYDKLSQL